jgi:5-hydroxyisourate hydrolase
MAGGISVHAVDIAHHCPGSGLRVEVHRLAEDGSRELLADDRLDPDGVLSQPIGEGAGIATGIYEVLLHIGAFFAGSDMPPTLPAEVMPFRFRVFDPDLHYHLPIKFTPWGFSLYRGV